MSSKNALIIGVSEYEHISPLANTVNDAEDMAKALRELGFKVMLETNPTLTEFEDALENFAQAIQYNKEVALFYYSGHGIQVDGKNYLIPKDAELDRELRIKKQTVSMEEITEIISDARNTLNIFILDACRDNPFEGKHRNVTRGLAEVKNMPPSTYIAFAAGAGQTAGDGNKNERNGVFTSSFLKTLTENPSDELDMIFRKTRFQVLNKTKNKQEPWTNHNLSATHYLLQPKPEAEKNNDKEYIALLEMVYADGSVAPSERRLLIKKQKEFGISEARAEELEKEIQIRFAVEIKEYEESKKPSTTEPVGTNGDATSEEKKRQEEIAKQKLAEEKRLEEERLQKEKAEKEKVQAELLKKQEQERLEKERIEKERIESERKAAEEKKLEQEKIERERKEAEEIAKQKPVGAEYIKPISPKVSDELAEKSRLEKEREKKETIPSNYEEESTSKPVVDNGGNSKKGIFIGVAAILILAIGGWFGFKKLNTNSNEIGNSETTTIKKVELPKEIRDAYGIDYVLIPAGEYMRACPEGDFSCSESTPLKHLTKIKNDFYLGKYEVTQGQWKKIMGNNPSYSRGCGDNCPVESISWNQVQEFLKKINSQRTGADLKYIYRLPKEVEWQYAARGKTDTKYYWGAEKSTEYEWTIVNTNKVMPVGQKKPNPFGLYDLNGNVFEWSADTSKEQYFTLAFLMGGAYSHGVANLLHFNSLSYASLTSSGTNIGFRLLLEVTDNANTPEASPNTNQQLEIEKQKEAEQARIAAEKRAQELARQKEIEQQRIQEEKRAQELARQKEAEQQRIQEEQRAQDLARQKQTCENNGDTWTGSSCKKKAVAPSGGSGNWSAYQGKMTWEDAKAKCASIGMRLPSIVELKAAYASGIAKSWATDGDYYWSSTPSSDVTANGLGVYDGIVDDGLRTNNDHVRCVR